MDLYEVRLYSTGGNLLQVFDNWSSLNVERRLNDFSTHTFSMPSSDSRIFDFQKDTLFQVRRKNAYLDWYTEYIGFHRTRRVQITSTGLEIFTSYGRSFEDLLRRRSLAYTDPYVKEGPADDVMKQLVRENLSTLATPLLGRFVNGEIDLSVDPDLSLAEVWEGERSRRNLLDVLQEISKAANVDFYVDWVPPISFNFRTQFPRITRNLVFGVDFGNLANLDFTNSATEENNVVIIGNSYFKESGAIVDSPWNRSEFIVDPGNNTEPQQIETLADEELAKVAAKESLSLDVLQTPTLQYGRDYFLGDEVRVRMGDEFFNKIIMGVTITESGDAHKLDFAFGEPQGEPIVTSFRNVVRRLRKLET